MVGIQEEKPYLRKANSKDFDLNNTFLLGLQLAGLGRKEAETVPGMLNLSNGFMTTRYTELHHEFGLSIIDTSQEVLEKNLLVEMSSTISKLNGMMTLSVIVDAQWEKRGSGPRCKILSRCSVMLGNNAPGVQNGKQPTSCG